MTVKLFSIVHFLIALACWDLENPLIITLPSHNPKVQNDVRCIAAVKDRVWVGAGPSIFFLSAENLDCEVCSLEYLQCNNNVISHRVQGFLMWNTILQIKSYP